MDHQNLTYNTMDHEINWVLRQRLLLEEYVLELRYIKGEKKIFVDTLSCLLMKLVTLRNWANSDSFFG